MHALEQKTTFNNTVGESVQIIKQTLQTLLDQLISLNNLQERNV